MTDAFIKLGDTDVRELIAALRSGRVSAPYSDLQADSGCFFRSD